MNLWTWQLHGSGAPSPLCLCLMCVKHSSRGLHRLPCVRQAWARHWRAAPRHRPRTKCLHGPRCCRRRLRSRPQRGITHHVFRRVCAARHSRAGARSRRSSGRRRRSRRHAHSTGARRRRHLPAAPRRDHARPRLQRHLLGAARAARLCARRHGRRTRPLTTTSSRWSARSSSCTHRDHTYIHIYIYLQSEVVLVLALGALADPEEDSRAHHASVLQDISEAKVFVASVGGNGVLDDRECHTASHATGEASKADKEPEARAPLDGIRRAPRARSQ